MSLVEEGKCIHCDGEHCTACVSAASLLQPTSASSEKVKGWLFVHKGQRTFHYCPDCARSYLEQNT